MGWTELFLVTAAYIFIAATLFWLGYVVGRHAVEINELRVWLAEHRRERDEEHRREDRERRISGSKR